jgi:penicillin-binding protein 1A
MQEVLRSGTAASARDLSPNLAGKTGTTNENTDAWFVGGSPDLMTAVWVGFDTPSSLGDRQSAASVALPVWKTFMQRALAWYPDREYPVPAGVTFARVDPASGKALPPDDSGGMVLPFKLGTIPEFGRPAAGAPSPRRGGADDLL